MTGHGNSFTNTTPICTVILIVCCSVAAAQGTSTPAVSVSPVASRPVTETGGFVGRVVAIDRVDVVSRVPGFIEQRNFTEGPAGQKGRPSVPHRTGHLQGGGRPAERQSRQGKGDGSQCKSAAPAGSGAGQKPEHPTIHRRPASGRCAGGQGRRVEAQALLEQAQINLGYTEIRSPIDGRVGLANFTVGNLVDPSSGRLATIVSQDPIYVTFSRRARPTSSRISVEWPSCPTRIRM